MIESKLQSAVPYLESFVDSVPNHWKGVFTLGLTYLRLGRLKAAQTAFVTARRLRPKNAIIEFNRAMVLVRLGEVRKAAEALTTAVELRYSLWEAHCERARILHRLGRYADAEAGYAEAVKLNPKLVVAKAVLASGTQTGMGYMFQGLPCSSVRYLDIRD
ncbi:MAG TPA: tetratricopeptide repeat protein [Myxococcales bacterium]|nr:tetratricopeptide repeat protein [Myxococcales bacterium]